MDHSEATQKMASERYLLGELGPDELNAFEEHMFGCPACAMDVRAADAFMREAKAHLTQIPVPDSMPTASLMAQPKMKKQRLFFSWKPMFTAPAFAALLAVIAYQNFDTIPRLRSEATEPRIVPWASLHIGSRGGAATAVQADRDQGAVLLVQLPQSGSYLMYGFDFRDANSKQLWSRTVSAPSRTGDGTLSLVIPPTGLEAGSYTLAVSGISSQGERTEIDRRALDIHFNP